MVFYYISEKLNLFIRLRKKRFINSSNDVFQFFRLHLRRKQKSEQAKEHFWVVALARDNRVLFIDLLSVGGLTGTIVDPSSVFRMAIKKSYLITSLILVHNHPSGNRKPSRKDVQITDKLIKAGELLEIRVIDHLIITTDNGYYSFADDGRIFSNCCK